MVDVAGLRDAVLLHKFTYQQSNYTVTVGLFSLDGKRYTGAFIRTAEDFTYAIKRRTRFTDLRKFVPLLRPHAAMVGEKAVQKALTGNFQTPTAEEQAFLDRVHS